MKNQLTRGACSVYYKGRTLKSIGGRGISGNFVDDETGEEYWVSGVKRRGSNAHPVAGGSEPVVNDDAREAYAQIKHGE